MPSLREFLRDIASDNKEVGKVQRRHEWLAALNRLIAQCRTWLQEADTQGVLSVYVTEIYRLEKDLGPYQAPVLEVELGDAHVKMLPIGRNVLGFQPVNAPSLVAAHGRVDLTNGAMKYNLYRLADAGQDRWMIVDYQGVTQELNQAAFEKIMLELLS